MPYSKYMFSLKSAEDRGAGQPNIVHIGLLSDDDADVFKTNLESAFAADVVTVNKILSSDYTLPYPAGVSKQVRLAMWAGAQEAQARIQNFDVAAGDLDQLCADLITAGIRLPVGAMPLATFINGYYIQPQAFMG